MNNSLTLTTTTNNNVEPIKQRKIPCLNCKKSRKKCSKTATCTRCQSLNLSCEYINFGNKYFFESRIDTLFDRLETLENNFFSLRYKFEFGSLPSQSNEAGWTGIRYTLKSGKLLNELHPLAFFQFKLNFTDNNDSYIRRGASSSDKVKLYQNSITPLPFKYLLELFKLYLHPLYPFINLKKLIKLLDHNRYDNPLLICVILRAHQLSLTFNLKEGGRSEIIPKLEDIPLYQLVLDQLKVQCKVINLEIVQVYAMLSLLELNEDLLNTGSIHLTKAINLGTQLSLDSWLDQSSSVFNNERAATWLFLQYLEQFYFLCTRKPKVIKYNHFLSNFINIRSDSNIYNEEVEDNNNLDRLALLDLNYSNIHSLSPTTIDSNLNCILNYHHYIYYSKSLFKIKTGFKPNLVTSKEIEKLNLMRSELKEIIFIKFYKIRSTEGGGSGENSTIITELTLDYFSQIGFGYLINYCLFTIILLDITELLLLYYYDDPLIKQKLELDQKKLSLQTIELLIPTLNNKSTIYNFINRLDPLISQTLFHCLKSILKNNFKINLNYFKACVISLMESNNYWEGNINIEVFLRGFGNCDILRKVLRMIKYEENPNN